MTESIKYYEAIRREYPETISKEQFYRIAHISKATALHLLQSGLVPCKDSGKKTRRYTIRTDDVIMGRDPVELAKRAKYKPPAMRVRDDCYTKKSPFRYNEVVQANL